MKILSGILASIVASSVLFAADFSKSSNADLLNMAGKVKAEEAKDFFAEIEKRIDEMTGKEAREFREKFRANEEKVFDTMKVKDIRAYKQSLAGVRGGMPCEFGGAPDRGGKGKGDRGFGKGQGKPQGKCGANCPNPPAKPAK